MRPVRTLAALALLSTAPLAALGAQVVIGPRTAGIQLGAPGDTVVVPIVADMSAAGGASLGSVTARLTWRPSVLRLIGVSAGGFGAPASNLDSANGELRFASVSLGGASGQATLLNARFQAIGATRDSSTLAVLVDEMSAAGTLAPLPVVSTASLVCVGAVAGRWGDITGDDQVMSNDALAIVTSAVGLSIAPLTVNNGDVDSSGTVTSRDALIVLSFAVGLSTSQFRVNLIRQLCTVTPATALALTPTAVQLRPGDHVPVAAVARDASLAIVHTPAVQWISRDSAVATVDAAGDITAVGAGTTRIVAIAAPGVMDSVSVDVNALPRVWFVNGGHSNPVEHGSQAYPFSSIGQALAAAAVNDTIRVAVAEYGEQLRLFRPVVILGDSGAAGFPRIRPTAGPAMLVDSVGTGTVIARRLEMPSTDGAVRARGAGGLLELDRLRITGSRSHAVKAIGFGSLVVTGGHIIGSADGGIEVDSTPLVTLSRHTVDLVSTSAAGSGFALTARTGTTLTMDSVSLRGGGAQVQGFSQVLISRGELAGGSGTAALTVVGADSVDLAATRVAAGLGGVFITSVPTGVVRADSLTVDGASGLVVSAARAVRLRRLQYQNPGGGPGLLIQDADTVHLAGASINGGDLRITRTTLVPMQTTLDTVAVHGGRVQLSSSGGQVRIHGGLIENGADQTLQVMGADYARVERLEVRQTRLLTPSFALGPHALDFASTDTIVLDSVYVHDNGPGALLVVGADSLDISRSRFDSNFLASNSGSPALVQLQTVRSTRIARTRFDQRSGATYFGLHTAATVAGGKFVLDTVQVIGSMVYGAYLLSNAGGGDSMIVRGSSFTAGGVPLVNRYIGFAALYWDNALFAGNTVDSVDQQGLLIYSGNAVATNNVVRGTSDALVIQGPVAGPALVTGNMLTCHKVPSGARTGLRVTVAQPTITGNSVTDCRTGIQVQQYVGFTPGPAVVRQNTVRLDSAGSTGLEVSGAYSSVEVALNDVSGADTVDSYGLVLATSGTWTGTRVDSNFVHDYRGHGIRIDGFHGSLGLRGNDVRRLGSVFGGPSDGIYLAVGNNGAVLRGNRADQIRGYGLHTNGISGTLVLDSNVFADDSLSGALLGGVNSMTGRYNRFSRNRIGMEGGFGGTIDSSAFQGNTLVGAGGGSAINVANNWWGHPSGPRCGASCPGALGDSVQSSLVFTPFLADSAGGRIPNGVAPVQPGAPAGLRAGAPPMPRLPAAAAPGAMIGAERERLRARAREERP